MKKLNEQLTREVRSALGIVGFSSGPWKRFTHPRADYHGNSGTYRKEEDKISISMKMVIDIKKYYIFDLPLDIAVFEDEREYEIQVVEKWIKD